METVLKFERVLSTDKKTLQRIVEEQNLLIGLVRDPNATAEESRKIILTEGVVPEDNIFSCGILSSRDQGQRLRGLNHASPRVCVNYLASETFTD